MTTNEYTASHEDGTTNHDLALQGMGAVAMHETEQQVTRTPEISAERESTFAEKNPEGTYYLFCGDDRNLTTESAEALAGTETEHPDTAIRYYGGEVGAARVLATAVAMQYGAEALQTYSGSFADFVKDQGQRISTVLKVQPGVHSAHDNEGNATHLDDDSEKGIGCAYAAGAQAVTNLSSSEALVDLAQTEEQQLFGANAGYVDRVAEANRAVESHFSHGGQVGFGLDRSSLQQLDAPVAILEGAHASVDQAVVVMNFHVDKISNPRRANETNVPFYNNDVTQVAEMLIRANPDLNLDPRTLLAVMDQDIRATREALASHEGKHADDLRVERYGDPEAAIAYLESIK